MFSDCFIREYLISIIVMLRTYSDQYDVTQLKVVTVLY